MFRLLALIVLGFDGFEVEARSLPVNITQPTFIVESKPLPTSITNGNRPISLIPQGSVRHVVYVEKKPKEEGPCIPCELMDKECNEWIDSGFEFTTAKNLQKREMYPHISWKVNDKWYWVEGWYGKEAFKKQWDNSFKVKSKSVAPIFNPFSRTYSHVGVRGSVEWHLRADHGVNTAGMTHSEMVQAHKAIHSGISSQTINTYLKSRNK